MDSSRRSDLRPLTKSSSVKQQARVKSVEEKNRLIGSSCVLGEGQEEHKDYLTTSNTTTPMASQRQSPRAWATSRLAKLKRNLAGGLSLLLAVALLLAATPASTATTGEQQQQQQQQQHESKAALEAELNSLLQQHGDGQEANTKALSEAIISRWMLGNLSDAASASSGGGSGSSGNLDELTNDLDGAVASVEALQTGTGGELDQSAEQEPTGPEAMRLRKLISFLRNFELSHSNSGLNNGQVFNQFPVLPASQAATIKRASLKMGNYLRQQQQQQPHGPPRQISTYGRNSFDFGLGKRPDSSVAGNILRFGDSGIPVSGSFGKRPSAHRYDFGLGKRVASPAYPRYDFGLGKRAPNRIRYDFGLGKR